jgi:ribosomal-protein-alanine acetyltransferase/tRNA threonylcarbamoyl adenosine modification protein YeaZ
VIGLAIETATEHVELLVSGPDGAPLAQVSENVGHGHTRRLAALIERALGEARVGPRELRWVAADLGPGSFTGVRVGLATAEALAMVSGAERHHASSLAALALSCGARRALVVPLVPAGRRDLYAGWFRADSRGSVSLLAAPEVGPAALVLERASEALGLLATTAVRFVGPGAARERAALEVAHPGSVATPWRADGLSAHDLMRAALSDAGPAAGLPKRGGRPEALYIRPAQAEERVRHRLAAADPAELRPFRPEDIPRVAAVEREVFSDPWPESFFAGELRVPLVYARIAERGGTLAGYSVAWLGAGEGHLGNIATVAGARRRGVASTLVADLLREARERGVEAITLEVRVSNFAAQWLYRRFGFRLAGLRRRYYGDTGEDALVMEWRAPRSAQA